MEGPAMDFDVLPTPESNFTPIPHAYLERLFASTASREEIIVTLYCFYRSYGWRNEQGALHAESVAHKTGLSSTGAAAGLDAAVRRGVLVRLPLEPDDPRGLHAPYLLNTQENRRFVEAYCEATPADPIAPPVETPRHDEVVENDYAGYDDDVDVLSQSSSDVLLYDDEVADEPPAAPPVPTGRPAETDGLPYHPKTVDMLVKLLGRPLSKSEHDRLQDLGATDPELIGAMSSLLSKTTQVYSSDLVIYEYERLKARDRQAEKYERAKADREAQLSRQKSCKRCEGLGYVVVGVNNIRECECRSQDDE